MLSNKLKKVLASISAVAMLSCAVTAPMSVFAGQQLGQCDFEENIGLPWHICESGTAKMKFDVSDGKYNIEIVKPGGAANDGEDRWDCQFRHRGLHIEKGHEYTISYTITSDTAGQYYTKIGNLDAKTEDGLDAGEAWHNHGKATIESSLTGKTEKDIKDYEGWNLIPIKAGETIKFTSTWTAKGSLQVAEWAFHLGGPGPLTPGGCFPEGTHITFDDMSLVDNTSDEYDYKAVPQYEFKDIAINQLGYMTDLKKQATYSPSNGEPGRYRKPEAASGTIPFEIMKGGTSVYKGTSKAATADKDSGNNTYVLDFSDFKTPGEGYTIKVDGKESYPFTIGAGKDIYEGLLEDSLNYFYLNRSGCDIESKYVVANNYDKQIASAKDNFCTGSAISKSNLAREAGHPKDVAYIQDKWIPQYKTDGSDVQTTNGEQDVTGGWYDAGDYGKYVVNGGISVWTLLNIYERALANGTEANYADGTMAIPENSNSKPDILDEVKYEMDFFLKMICKSGEYEGMAYHKMHDFKWTGLAISPAESTETEGLYRIIKPVSTAASLNLAAAGAQFARLYDKYDSTYAAKCLDAAKTAYAAAKKNDDKPAPLDQNKGGGPYGDTYFKDDFYWAACELWLTTGDDAYLKDMKASTHYLECPTTLTGGENFGDVASFNWGNTQALGTLSLAVNYDKITDADMKKTIFDNVKTAADDFIKVEDSQGYGDPYTQGKMKIGETETDPPEPIYITGYNWGSNSFVINNAIVLAMAYNISGDAKYASGAVTACDYIFGRNPNEISYVTGYGSHHTTFVHHRYWSGLLDPEKYPIAPSGVLSGGPNSGLQDPYVQGAGYKVGQTAPQLCYLDHIEAWSTNECTVNWNSPLAWMADFLDDYSNGIAFETGKQLPTGGSSSTTDPTDPDLKYGDIDQNGVVDMSDMTLLSQYLVHDVKTLTDTQMKLADVNGDGTVSLPDLSHFKQYIQLDKVVLGPQPKK